MWTTCAEIRYASSLFEVEKPSKSFGDRSKPSHNFSNVFTEGEA